MSNLNLHPSAAPTYHQLGLPGLEPQSRPLPLAPPPPTVQPPNLWASLSPTQKTQVRQTIVHMVQEVLDDRPQP
jgi:hypothetical protein